MGRKSQSKPTGAHHPYQQPLVLWILPKCPSATRPRAFARIKQPKRKESISALQLLSIQLPAMLASLSDTEHFSCLELFWFTLGIQNRSPTALAIFAHGYLSKQLPCSTEAPS